MTFIPCRIAQLPAFEVVAAARTAVYHNPANRPVLWGDAELIAAPHEEQAGGAVPQIMRLALLTSKYWGAAGVKLGVTFLDSPPQSVRNRILAHANAWGTRANVMFAESAQGEVRLARTSGDGYWSYLGTDILHVSGPTMNLDSFSDGTPESEYIRVVRHEMGHTCGFPHEHMRRQIVQRLDPAKTVAYFGRTQGWTPQEVQQQVLTPLDEASLTATPNADMTSIMCYQLPGEITVDGQPISGGLDIDESDFVLAAKLYPKASNPVQPPSPPTSTVVTLAQVLACDNDVFTRLITAFRRVPGATTALSAALVALKNEHAALFNSQHFVILEVLNMTVTQQLDQLIQLTKLLHTDLGGTSQVPAQLKTLVRDAGPGLVTVTFSWDAPGDGGVTTGYSLTITNPDGTVVTAPLGLVTTLVQTLPDDNRPYGAALLALPAGSPPVPATTTFTPHVTPPPPPPPVAATPTGFRASVAA